MITVYIKKMENIPENEKQNIVNSLSESALARLDKKRNEALRLASLCALSVLTDKQLSDLDYTESGRPFFATLDADISISHSKEYASVAISTSKNELVGIDIEDNSSLSNSLIRFFTENERIVAENGASPIAIWTKKEALFKYLKNDDIPFISLDSTTADAKFTSVQMDNSTLTVCTSQDTKIKIIQK